MTTARSFVAMLAMLALLTSAAMAEKALYMEVVQRTTTGAASSEPPANKAQIWIGEDKARMEASNPSSLTFFDFETSTMRNLQTASKRYMEFPFATVMGFTALENLWDGAKLRESLEGTLKKTGKTETIVGHTCYEATSTMKHDGSVYRYTVWLSEGKELPSAEAITPYLTKVSALLVDSEVRTLVGKPNPELPGVRIRTTVVRERNGRTERRETTFNTIKLAEVKSKGFFSVPEGSSKVQIELPLPPPQE